MPNVECGLDCRPFVVQTASNAMAPEPRLTLRAIRPVVSGLVAMGHDPAALPRCSMCPAFAPTPCSRPCSIGMPPIVYELLDVAVTLWSHSNLRLPAAVDRALRYVIVTPDLHRVHHSAWRPGDQQQLRCGLSRLGCDLRNVPGRAARRTRSYEAGPRRSARR